MVNIIRDKFSVYVADRVVNAMVTGIQETWTTVTPYCTAPPLDSWEDYKRYRTQQQDSF